MPNISKHLIALLLALCAVGNAYAQKRTVEEVKKSISDLSADLKAYKSAQSKLKPLHPKLSGWRQKWNLVSTTKIESTNR